MCYLMELSYMGILNVLHCCLLNSHPKCATYTIIAPVFASLIKSERLYSEKN